MRLDAFILSLASDLEKWTKEQGGVFHVARDPLHPYVILAGGNYKSFVVILSYDGSSPENSEQHPHGVAGESVKVFLGFGLDLRADPTAWLMRNDGEKESLLKRLDVLRARLMTIVFHNGENMDDAYAENKGIEQANLPDGTPLKAFTISASWPIKVEVDEAQYRFLN